MPRPSRLRFLAAFLTSATAAFLLTQLLSIGEAEEPADRPTKAELAVEDALVRRVVPTEEPPFVPPKPRVKDPLLEHDTYLTKKSRSGKLVRHFGGY